MTEYGKPDYWSQKAQKEGYPARSVYKLREIDEKFGLIKSGNFVRILDLGSAPGSWSLFILKKFLPGGVNPENQKSGCKTGSFLVSVDISPLSRQYDHGIFDRQDFFFIQGDFTLPAIRDAILSHSPYNLIMSDAAPATTGNRSVDTLRSLELAQTVLEYAVSGLAPGGNLVIKVFQGEDTGDLLKQLKKLFITGKSFKPEACRQNSFETYFLGFGKK